MAGVRDIRFTDRNGTDLARVSIPRIGTSWPAGSASSWLVT